MTLLFSVSHSSAGTFHRDDAALINISRAAAPICRMRLKNEVVLSLLPVNCQLIRGFRYAGSVGEFSNFTRFQSAPSSSAMSAGMVVDIPWPISACETMMVAIPSGAIRNQALSATSAASPSAARTALPKAVERSSRPPPASDAVRKNPLRETRNKFDLTVVATSRIQLLYQSTLALWR